MSLNSVMESLLPHLPSSMISLAKDFSAPPITARPKIRWWWVHGMVDPSEISNEIDQMYAAGFGGGEINDVHPSITVPVDPAGHGWGTDPWIDAVSAAYDHADSLDFQVDIALGPSYPASVPSLRPDDDGAATEVVSGRIVVGNGTTYRGAIPSPYAAASSGVNNETLLALQAWRVNSSSLPTAVPVVLDSTSLIDLTKQAKNGNITWTPPDNGTWLLLSFHMRGTGQPPEAGPHNDPDGTVIDHFSIAGSEASINYWKDNIISQSIEKLLKRVKGSIFEDSLELKYNTLWTPLLPVEFEKRHGYDIFSIIPGLALENQKQAFSFSDTELTRGVLNDYWDTMGALYVENHANVIKSWAESMNMKLRAQPYGLPTDCMSAMAALSIPEGETLEFKNLGDFRSVAGAANMAGLPLLSTEACAFAGGAYSTTWEEVVSTLNPVFSTGMNHMVLHGFPYITAPQAEWPGFAAFTPYKGGIGYGDAWGPREPMWKHATDVTGYLSRMQLILQRGVAQHDVAWFSQKGYVGAGYNTPWFSAAGTMEGWSLNIIGPTLLQLPNGKVRNQVLAPDGPGYRVLAFEGDDFSNKESVMTLDSATRIAEYAKEGLPILVVGNWSVVNAYGHGEASDGPKITALFAELLKLKNVANVATEDDIPEGVATLGILPNVQYNSSQLINFHKVDGDLDHFLFVASTPTAFAISTKVPTFGVEVDVIIPRRHPTAVPVVMDLWTGEMIPLGLYTEISPTQIRVHLSLHAYQATMITLATLPTLEHATSTTANTIYRSQNGLVLRSNSTGTFETVLNGGHRINTRIGAIPPPLELQKWTLAVQDYRPGQTNTTTTIIHHTIELEQLTVWTNITELVDVSGIGTYNTSFNLHDWPSDAGAMLQIPSFLGSFRITVNGKKMPPVDQLDVQFDIGPYLKSGTNTLAIEVATTLLNRMRLVEPDVYEVATRQAFGLVGPVIIRPYREEVIAS